MKWWERFGDLIINSSKPFLRDDRLVLEVISDKPDSLIDYIFENGGRILWVIMWDRARVDEGSPLGYGGPVDTRDINYYFAETDEQSIEFEPTVTKKEILQYIHQVNSKYGSHHLYAGFQIEILISLDSADS